MRQRGKVIRFPGAPEPPASTATPGVRRERGLVEIHRCGQSEALVVKSLLESESIPTLLRSRFAHSVHPFTVGTQGEVVILVPDREVVRSRALLVRIAPRPSSP